MEKWETRRIPTWKALIPASLFSLAEIKDDACNNTCHTSAKYVWNLLFLGGGGGEGEENGDLLQNKNVVYLALFEDFSAVQITHTFSTPEIKGSVNNVFSNEAEIFKMHRLKGETNGIWEEREVRHVSPCKRPRNLSPHLCTEGNTVRAWTKICTQILSGQVWISGVLHEKTGHLMAKALVFNTWNDPAETHSDSLVRFYGCKYTKIYG